MKKTNSIFTILIMLLCIISVTSCSKDEENYKLITIENDTSDDWYSFHVSYSDEHGDNIETDLQMTDVPIKSKVTSKRLGDYMMVSYKDKKGSWHVTKKKWANDYNSIYDFNLLY